MWKSFSKNINEYILDFIGCYEKQRELHSILMKEIKWCYCQDFFQWENSKLCCKCNTLRHECNIVVFYSSFDRREYNCFFCIHKLLSFL